MSQFANIADVQHHVRLMLLNYPITVVTLDEQRSAESPVYAAILNTLREKEEYEKA